VKIKKGELKGELSITKAVGKQKGGRKQVLGLRRTKDEKQTKKQGAKKERAGGKKL